MNKLTQSEIKFTIQLDENKLPVSIDWEATESDEKGKKPCKSIILSIWDANEKTAMRIDLWTKDMPVDEMKQFFHQILLSMADTFERATGEKAITGDLRDFCHHFAEKMELTKKE